MEQSSQNCVIQNSDSSLEAPSKSCSSYPVPRKKTSRVTHPDSGLNISDSFSILEREKISANYLSDLWPGERDHDKVVKPSSKLTEQRLFLICESCFWCTSYFRSGYLIHDCPVCYNGKLDCMPIGDGEKYRFDNSLPTGVEVQFSSDILMWSKNES
jgi:hypothetical protein